MAKGRDGMKVFGLAGWSGSGKKTLMVKLVPEMISRGLTVSTMKHTHHSFDIDKPGKDSFEHRAAGATEVMVTSAKRWALMHELRGVPEPTMDEQMARMTPVDILLVEGFKSYKHAKMEVFRPSVGKPMLCRDDPTIVAIASDEPLHGLDVPVLDLNDVGKIADFIVAHVGLEAMVRNGAA